MVAAGGACADDDGSDGIGDIAEVTTTADVTTTTVATTAVLPAPPVPPPPIDPWPPAGNTDGAVEVPAEARPADSSQPDRVVGDGSAASCTSAAVVDAVAHRTDGC